MGNNRMRRVMPVAGARNRRLSADELAALGTLSG